MGLQSANFASGTASDMLLTDLKRQKPLIAKLMASPMSQRVLAQAQKLGSGGGFATQVVIPLLANAALSPTDGYSTVSAFPSSTEDPDLSSAYAALADYPVTFKINRVIVGTNYIPTIHQWQHSAGDLLMDQAVINNRDRIGDLLEQGVVADMVSSSGFESVSSGAGVKFALDTTSAANLLADLADLAGEFNRQNVPADKRVLLLPASVEPVLSVQYSGSFSTRDQDTAGSLANGVLPRVAGFELIFSNNIGASDAIAFNPDQYALVMPKGIVIEELKDKDRIGDFMRMYAVAGWGSVSEIVAAADGNSPTLNASRAGVVALSVS